MDSRFKVAGHAVHPMLITVPLGMFLGTAAFDVAHVVSDSSEPATVAYWMIATGVIGGILASVFGVIDWLGVPKGTRARRVGLLHALTNDVVMVLYALSWLLRRGEDGHEPTTLALVLAFAGLVVSGLSGWLGGELVERLGVSVSPQAHLDAPSSLRESGLIEVNRSLADAGSPAGLPRQPDL